MSHKISAKSAYSTAAKLPSAMARQALQRQPLSMKSRGFSVKDLASRLPRNHPIPCLLFLSLLFFMGVEYTLPMVPSSSPPLDIGFLLTQSFHAFLAARPELNSFLAALNTVFVGMQVVYILWALLVEGRPRPTVAALFMFTFRGVVGYATQLPLPPGFLGSGVDFPVGNVSFFLFFSGHVGGAVIASLDMRRIRRRRLAIAFDVLNSLQALRLLATRGHYTIDLAAGIAAGFISDVLSGMYESRVNKFSAPSDSKIYPPCCKCRCK
ncbi:phosphatidylcholine:diacylglycerol cholinephosphotransferase 1-like [Phalaenopsis equestris]|uniref:phosphatidylcholine:diacylglycerol cholinephosphotransferase 1-like n=1 Tax=Phalaenopsis equestris TaxID=78828 RepID=UPI0009E54093|nr:phosphatidylcholine:diacylglycerol cholinephosphotransferase 1-like [Phalaenopsis equestris]